MKQKVQVLFQDMLSYIQKERRVFVYAEFLPECVPFGF